MKKILNIDSITNELEGASLFFTRSASPPPQPQDEPKVGKETSFIPESPTPAEPANETIASEKINKPKKQKSKQPSNRDTTTPRYHDTTASGYQDTTTPQIHGVLIEQIRKAVKEFGKEAATHRFTLAEKKEIADLIYTYKNTGIKTSENEIARVAVNFVVEDYKVNGENSVLHKILKALNE